MFDPAQYKEGLLEPVDMGGFVIHRGDVEVRPFAGESVWLEPYMDSRTELALMRKKTELADSPDNVEAFMAVCEVLAEMILGWNLTDGKGDALPAPDSADAILALPSAAVMFLLKNVTGESEGEESGASKNSPNGSSGTGRSRTRRK